MADSDPTGGGTTGGDTTSGDTTGGDTGRGDTGRGRPGRGITRRPLVDPATLVFGLIALLTAGSAFVGRFPVLPGIDGRWVLAAGAALLGLLLLAGTLRRRRP